MSAEDTWGLGNNFNYRIKRPTFYCIFNTPTELNIKIIDSEDNRWEIPHRFPFPHDPVNKTQSIDAERDYDVRPFSSANTDRFPGSHLPLVLPSRGVPPKKSSSRLKTAT
jgi:hypothetical protein